MVSESQHSLILVWKSQGNSYCLESGNTAECNEHFISCVALRLMQYFPETVMRIISVLFFF